VSKVRIIVNGAQGNMGQLACEAIEQHPEFELLAGLGRADDLAQAIGDLHANIVVDLTRADRVYQNSLAIINQGAHPVIGTSGLLEPEIKALRELCAAKKLGGLIVPNFSIAAMLMMQFAEKAAHYLPDVEIVEAHHPAKAEAPSGTALKTADMIARARTHAANLPDCQEIVPGARGALHHDVRIHSIRLPGTLAQQDVIFGQLGETLTLRHQTMDRLSFMPGVLLACQKVQKLDGLVYGLDQLLD